MPSFFPKVLGIRPVKILRNKSSNQPGNQTTMVQWASGMRTSRQNQETRKHYWFQSKLNCLYWILITVRIPPAVKKTRNISAYVTMLIYWNSLPPWVRAIISEMTQNAAIPCVFVCVCVCVYVCVCVCVSVSVCVFVCDRKAIMVYFCCAKVIMYQ